MPDMPSINNLTESGERILVALWKLKGIGKNHIREESLKADPAVGSSDDHWKDEIANLQNQGFLETVTVDNHHTISLTALGLAILRQIEEDKLQELK